MSLFGHFLGLLLSFFPLYFVIQCRQKEVKSMWIPYNANPDGVRGIDCTVRAISTITDDSWDATYMAICVEGLLLRQMPSANAVWGSYLDRIGYVRRLPHRTTTVNQFCADNPLGDYILALSGHVVAVKNGDWFDTWDSGDEIVIYYWGK